MQVLKALIILSVLFLYGCDHLRKQPEKEIVYKTKTVLIVPPEGMLKEAQKLPPPDRETYLKSGFQDKEKLLVDLTISLYTEIDKCNSGVVNHRVWLDKQKKLYTKEE
jgi:hypothetical protein